MTATIRPESEPLIGGAFESLVAECDGACGRATDIRIVPAAAFDPVMFARPGTRVLVFLTDDSARLGRVEPAAPLVRSDVVEAKTTGGLNLRADDIVVVPADGAEIVAHVGDLPVAAEHRVSGGVVVVIGSVRIASDRWIAAADNAAFLTWAATGQINNHAVDAALRFARSPRPHRHVPELRATWSAEFLARVPRGDGLNDDDGFVRAAGHAGRLLDPALHDALVDFVDDPGPVGSLLLRGVDVGAVPPTPAHPTDPTGKDHRSEFALLTVGRRLGQPVGYAPEHGGSLVQNLVPTRADVGRQTSTSSGVSLDFHTETAFHPHRPRYLMLLCLRGDPAAATTLCSLPEVIDALPTGTRQILREPLFRTGVDESFGRGHSSRSSLPVAVIGGNERRPSLVFDSDLMFGTTPEACRALDTLRDVIAELHLSVTLDDGDLLVIDNTRCVHGRGPYDARFDGTDRWIQRSFVVPDLAPSDGDRAGRVITTRFDI